MSSASIGQNDPCACLPARATSDRRYGLNGQSKLVPSSGTAWLSDATETSPSNTPASGGQKPAPELRRPGSEVTSRVQTPPSPAHPELSPKSWKFTLRSSLLTSTWFNCNSVRKQDFNPNKLLKCDMQFWNFYLVFLSVSQCQGIAPCYATLELIDFLEISHDLTWHS